MEEYIDYSWKKINEIPEQSEKISLLYKMEKDKMYTVGNRKSK